LGEGPEEGIPFGDDGGFTKGPAQIRIAEFGPAQAFDFAGTGDSAFDQAAVTEEIFDAGKAGNVPNLVEDGQAEVIADARGGFEQGEVAAGGLFGQLQELFFEAGELGVIMADEGQIVLQGELADGIGFAGEEMFFPRLPVVKGLAGGGPVVGELMGLNAGQEFAAVPDVEEALTQQGAQGPFRRRINVARRNQVGAEQVGDFFRVHPVVLVFAAVNGLEVERVSQDEVNVGGLAGIGEPIPAEHALGADGQIVAIRGNELEEIFEVIVANVGVDQFFAGAVHDADVHLAGMEINSAVEFSGGGVILHSDHSLRGRETPVSYVWLCGEVLVTLPRPAIYAITKPKGLRGEYQFAAGNSHRPFSFDRDMKFEHHHSIAGLAARWLCLSFCR
jgi:hypothetical protein